METEITAEQLKTTYQIISQLEISTSVRKKLQEALILKMAEVNNVNLFED